VRRGLYRVWVGKPEGKRQHGNPGIDGVDDIKMDVQEVGCGSMDWMELSLDRNR
jgi:hypothetical protein